MIMLLDNYFEWLINYVSEDGRKGNMSYRLLFEHLHHERFYYLLQMDRNRAQDGIDLRYRYASQYHDTDYIYNTLCDTIGDCTVLEMILSLAIICEESIMDDPEYGNRTSQWFWSMLRSLGVGNMDDSHYDFDKVDFIVRRFLDRKYMPDGRGGLFTIRNCEEDMRDVEIWYQMNWYLDTVT